MAVGAVRRFGGTLAVYTGATGGLVRELGEASHDFGVCGGDGGITGRGRSDSKLRSEGSREDGN